MEGRGDEMKIKAWWEGGDCGGRRGGVNGRPKEKGVAEKQTCKRECVYMKR